MSQPLKAVETRKFSPWSFQTKYSQALTLATEVLIGHLDHELRTSCILVKNCTIELHVPATMLDF